MSKHYPTSYRLHASYLGDKEQSIPVWAWLLATVVILLVLIVR
jgi:hypothetical protein